jgi:hypothetical protein
MVDFEVREEVSNAASDGARFLGAAAGNDGNSEGFGVATGEGFRDVDERADEAEVFLPGRGDGGQGTEASGEERVAEERLAEIVGSVAEGDDVGSEAAGDLIDGAAAVAAA